MSSEKTMVKAKVMPARKYYAGCACLGKMMGVREQRRCFPAKVVARSTTGAALKAGLRTGIFFTGVHGPVPLAEFVRYAEERGILKNSCFARGVMVHITVTASIPHTRMLVLDLICALNIQDAIVADPMSLEMA